MPTGEDNELERFLKGLKSAESKKNSEKLLFTTD